MSKLPAIRVMERDDAAAVAVLIGQLGYQRSQDSVRGWIEELDGRANSQAAFVACVEGEVVAWIEVSIERRLQTPPFALIGGLVVKEGARGMGIGRRLCVQAELWGRQRGVETLRVTSRSTRADAHRFYLRDGYREVKMSVVFEKKLPGD
ncbi:MAG TPA: GNAT family N-acetyltransferase [Acidobacteriaceae bacterium]